MDSGLLFCKVIFTSDDEEQLEIPPTIVKHLEEVVSDEVVLKDRYTNTWPVKVSKSREKWCFKMGWHQFFEDNLIKVGDILVFSYKDQNSFNVTLFGEDSCEKAAANLCPAEEEVAPAAAAAEEDQCVKKEASEFEDDEEEVYQSNDLFDSSDENYQGEEEEENDYSDNSAEGYEEEEEQEQVHKRKKNSNDKSKSSTSFDPIKKEDGEAAGDNINAKTKTRYKKQKQKQKQKQKIIDYYGKDIFALGLALRPANPYFVSRSRCPRRANELHIPKKLISHYGLNLPKSLQLVDEKGMEWETRIKRWKDGRVWCCGGWGALSRVNDIGFDDTCICEFVQDHRKGLSILVRVVNTAN